VSWEELEKVKQACARLGIRVTPEQPWDWDEGFLRCSIYRMLKKRGRVDCLKTLNL
jgi:hypothetical protein